METMFQLGEIYAKNFPHEVFSIELAASECPSYDKLNMYMCQIYDSLGVYENMDLAYRGFFRLRLLRDG